MSDVKRAKVRKVVLPVAGLATRFALERGATVAEVRAGATRILEAAPDPESGA